ncbi:MAG TPA: hypothetical protein PLT30_15785 [Deltaproteobacteria bacterium]|nr:hypothetical protein [Deltaproteobacteria bacterium]
MGGSKGGSSTTTTYNYDPVASAKMAEIAERQQVMAEDQWDMYKTYFQDYEIAVAQANKDLLPYMTDSTREQLQYQQEAAAGNRELIPAATALNKKELEGQLPVAEKYYREALEGVDVGERMDSASTEVKAAAKLGESMRRREASRYGIDPGSTTFGNAVNKAALDTARGISGARTGAKERAEQENFQRLGLALDKSVAPVVGQGGAATVNNADPYSRAAGSYSGAAATYAPLATRVLSSTRTEESEGGFGNFVANVGGMALGSMAGGYFGGLGTKWSK